MAEAAEAAAAEAEDADYGDGTAACAVTVENTLLGMNTPPGGTPHYTPGEPLIDTLVRPIGEPASGVAGAIAVAGAAIADADCREVVIELVNDGLQNYGDALVANAEAHEALVEHVEEKLTEAMERVGEAQLQNTQGQQALANEIIDAVRGFFSGD